MAPSNETTVPSTRRVRKSVGASTEMMRTVDKENATVDVARTLADNRKKSRSKSIGPGGLDALKRGTGNRRAVSMLLIYEIYLKMRLRSVNLVYRRTRKAEIDS